MIKVLMTAAISFPIIFFMNKKRDGLIEGFSIVSFVAIPAIILLLLTIGGRLLGLSPILLLPLQALYFIVPFFMCRFMLECGWGLSSIYAGIVFGAHVVTSVLFILMLGQNA